MGTIKDFKYKTSPQFVSKDMLNTCGRYCEIRHRINNTNFEPIKKASGNYDTTFYADPLCEAIMDFKIPHMEELTGLKLLPTYSYWRMYTFDSILGAHIDRPSCEISVTINIASNLKEPWPIWMDDKPIYLQPGDAAIYLGEQVKHERKPFRGDYNSQIFLHYVDKNGPYSSLAMDGRALYGLMK